MSDLTAYTKMTYERTRKGKMYLKNDRTVIIDGVDVLEWLKGIEVTSFRIRLFFTRFTKDSQRDLLGNYPEKFIQHVLSYALVENCSLAIKIMYCDSNTYVYDLSHEGDSNPLKTVLKALLSHDSLSFVSQIELVTQTNEGQLNFLLKGYREIPYQVSLFKPTDQVDIFETLPLDSPISQVPLEEYYQVLKIHYNAFYSDVQDRQCAVWCIREGRSEYIVRRWLHNEPIIFPDNYDKAEQLLAQEQIIQIVPNALPEHSLHPIELIIDVDPQNMKYEIVKIVTDVNAQKKSKKIEKKFRNPNKISEPSIYFQNYL